MKAKTLELENPDQNRAKALRLLLLEDAPQDAELVLTTLRRGGVEVESLVAASREEFYRALEQNDFDAIIADYDLPNWTGLAAFEALQKTGKDIPMLLVTGTLTEEAAIDCINRGISEFIQKDHLPRLPLALRRAIHEKKLRQDAARVCAALADSEARARQQFAELELLYRTAPVGLAMFDRECRFLRVNEHLAKINGIPATSHIPNRVSEILPLIGPQVESIIANVFETDEPQLNNEICGKLHGPEEPDCCWLLSCFPLRGEDDAVSGVSAVILDITERKRAEEALRVSEARNHDLVENSVYGIFRCNAEGEFLDANPALQRILGCDSQEKLRSLNLSRDVFRFPEQYSQMAASCRETGRVHGAETEWRRSDGGLVTVRLNLRRLDTAHKKHDMEVIAEDVTELRAMERQLRQAQKFEAVGQLAGGIAHDFNNVVGAILGWAELGFEQNKANPQVAERFSRIREQADRAAALTRELLAFARRQILQPRAVDLNTVASSLISFLDKVISKEIEIKVKTAPLDPVKADPAQIDQVLMNLCLNGRDAMPNGGRLLIETEMVEFDDSYCRFYPQAVPGRYAVISVSDTGMGMDTETRERVFEPFFTTKGRSEGTGMGLATVYGIVKQHGGLIHVYSEPGQGSLFRVYLPVLTQAVAQGTSKQVPAISMADLHGAETILLAEDHEAIREMCRQTLAGLGYRVLAAADGEEALRLCEKEAPALAILDVVMPKLGGPATAAKLAKFFPGLPVLFTSGYSQESKDIGDRAADSRYLQKPYSPSMLGRTVREILDTVKAAGRSH